MSYGASRASKGIEAFNLSKASAGVVPNLPPHRGPLLSSVMRGSLAQRTVNGFTEHGSAAPMAEVTISYNVSTRGGP